MSEKSIAIIGAGIAGLSAGCYAQMNGYRSEIFEMHTLPGGVCTSWRRGAYVFDGCIEWLVGVKPGSWTNRLWQELGALEGRRVVIRDECLRIMAPGGKCLVVSSDLDRLEDEMRRLSPGDAGLISALVRGSRRFAISAPPSEDMTPAQKVKAIFGLLPMALMLFRYRRQSIQQFAARFRDPFLRQAVLSIADLPDFPVAGLMMMLGWHAAGDAGYPIGGSLEFSRAIERRYLQLGGKVHYGRRVAGILVEEGKAAGLRTANGEEHRADIVISAADGHATVFNLLEGRYVNKEIRGYYDRLPVFPPLIQVSLGVRRDFSGQPHKIIHVLDEPLVIAGEKQPILCVKHYSYDPTLAPAGHSVLVVLILSRYDYWKALSSSRESYEGEKERIANTVIAALDKLYPGLAGQVEEADVATPMTWERYTGNWQASFEGWLLTTRTLGMVFRGGMKNTLPGLRNFYMAGQWVSPGGGVPGVAASARNVMRAICKADKKKFTGQVQKAQAASA